MEWIPSRKYFCTVLDPSRRAYTDSRAFSMAIAAGFWTKTPLSGAAESQTTKHKKTMRRKETDEKTAFIKVKEQAARGDAPIEKSR